jgi:hypothetical protein
MLDGASIARYVMRYIRSLLRFYSADRTLSGRELKTNCSMTGRSIVKILQLEDTNRWTVAIAADLRNIISICTLHHLFS